MRGRRRSFPWRTPRGGAGAAVIFIGTLILIAVLWGARGGQGPRFSGSPPWSPGVPPSAGPATTAPAFEAVRVARVDDGDTIRLAGGREVRYLGMDTPERGEPLAAEAREENRRLVEGREVEIRRGGPEPHDRYGRLLALVYAGDGAGSERVFVNAAILRAGLGWVYLTGPEAVDPAPLASLLEAQGRAITGRKGVWKRILEGTAGARDLVATRFRIHRRGCEELGGKRAPSVSSLEAVLRSGKSPCRTCRPLAE